MLGRVAVFGLFLLVGGCGSKTTPPPTTTPSGATDIPTAVSGPLGAKFAAQAQSLSGQSALAAQGAALALQAGVQADPVTLTASFLAAPPGGSASSALTMGGTPGYAFAYQLTILNMPGAPSTQVLTAVVTFTSASDAVLAGGLSPGGPIPPGEGLIYLGDTGFWAATAGTESATVVLPLGTPCPGPLPVDITACNKATFSNAGFNITASTPFGGATGNEMAMLTPGTLDGIAMTLDYTAVGVSIYPASATVAPLNTFQFTATVTGTTNTAVTWSVEPVNGAGMVVSTSPTTGLYTAPLNPGVYTVVATSAADPSKSGSATVTVANASPVTFFNYWAGAYTLTEVSSGSMLATGNVTFSINDSAQYGLYMSLLCMEGSEVVATESSPTVFNITGLLSGTSCPFVGQALAPCESPTISYTGGTGTLDAGPPASLSIMSLEGTVTGLNANNCAEAIQYTGSFGPASVYQN